MFTQNRNEAYQQKLLKVMREHLGDIGNDGDEKSFALPHPKRIQLSGWMEQWEAEAEQKFPKALTMLSDMSITKEECINFVLEQSKDMRDMMASSMMLPGTVDYGTFDVLFTPLRHKLCGWKMFQTTDALEQGLLHTDIGDKAPCSFFRSPYPSVFIEFGDTRSSPLCVSNIASGKHVLEGAYVNELQVVLNEKTTLTTLTKSLGFKDGDQARVFEIVFIGSPIGKDNYLDDATRVIKLYVKDEDETVESLLRRHIDYYCSKGTSLDGIHPLTEIEADEVRKGILHLSKVLLYLNSRHCKLRRHEPASELLGRFERVKGKKQAKIGRKLARAYDRVVVGPGRIQDETSHRQEATARGNSSGVSPHWRRGHLRAQRKGENLREVEIIWIQPVLVGGKRVGETDIAAKPYKVK